MNVFGKFFFAVRTARGDLYKRTVIYRKDMEITDVLEKSGKH
jgi:hypothetical protein